MKQPIFFNDTHEYDYELIDGNKYTLYASDTLSWNESFRGKILMQLEDDGNGLKILTNFEDKKRFNYCETGYLYVLLTVIEKGNKYEIITKKERL